MVAFKNILRLVLTYVLQTLGKPLKFLVKYICYAKGEGSSTPLQYSCLENPMGRGAWWLQSMGLRRVGHD